MSELVPISSVNFSRRTILNSSGGLDPHGTQRDDTVRQVVSLCTPVTFLLLALAKGWSTWDKANSDWAVRDHEVPVEWRLLGMTQ